jgi:hypothetical protein
LSHNDLLVTLTLSPTSTRLFGRHKCSICRASGLVQTGFSVNCPALASRGWGSCRESEFEGGPDQKACSRWRKLLPDNARAQYRIGADYLRTPRGGVEPIPNANKKLITDTSYPKPTLRELHWDCVAHGTTVSEE